jgi:hypothetical protein
MEGSGVIPPPVNQATELAATQVKGFKKAAHWKIALDSEKARFTCLEDNGTFDILKEEAGQKIVPQAGAFGSSSNSVSVFYERKLIGLALSPVDRNTLVSWLPPKTAGDMAKDLRGWGISLVIVGVISLLLHNILDPVWGAVLIVLGILNFVIRHRSMFIVNGIALIGVGLMNILNTFAQGGGGGVEATWAVFGIFQIGWGVSEIRKIKNYPS